MIAPYFTTTTTQEYAIARSAVFTTGGLPVFATNTFTLLAYSTDNGGKYLGPVQYTFATVPEPSMAMLFLCGGLIINRFIKRRPARRHAGRNN